MRANERRGADTEELLKAIRAGSQEKLQEVYLAHRQSFLDWAMKSYRCGQQDALDIYQEVIIAFYENVTSGKLDKIKSSLRTYLFGIGKLLIFSQYQKGKRFSGLEIIPETEPVDVPNIDLLMELDDRQQLMQAALKSLGENCRRLLLLYYYQRYSQESIMREMDYSNTDVVKSQKSRCMKALRKLVSERLGKAFRE